MNNRLKFLQNVEIREEIAYTVGGDPTRYDTERGRNLNKADILRAATQLQPEDNDAALSEMTIGDLYEVVCRWSGGEYVPNAGNPWGLRRPNLKKLHQALDAQPPREVVDADDNYTDEEAEASS